ncbi:hypothetical protein ACSVDA_12440 [Cytobacillus sp. Hm23]
MKRLEGIGAGVRQPEKWRRLAQPRQAPEIITHKGAFCLSV